MLEELQSEGLVVWGNKYVRSMFQEKIARHLAVSVSFNFDSHRYGSVELPHLFSN